MDIKMEVALISGAISIFINVSTIVAKRILENKKLKKEELVAVIQENQELFQILLEINRGCDIHYGKLKKALDSATLAMLINDKKIISDLDKLSKIMDLDISSVKTKNEEIKQLSEKVITNMRKFGVSASYV